MTLYPNGIDSTLQLPTVPGSSQEAISINAVRDAVIAIETELGILPKSIYSDVATRIAILEARAIGGGSSTFDGFIDAGTQLLGLVEIEHGGTGVGSVGSANTVFTSTGSAVLYKLLDNSNIDTAAAIAGTKISPNFGSQNVATTGTVQGASVILGSSGPTITTGAGVPSSSPPDGSIFLRTDGTADTALYTRQSGAWTVISGGSIDGVKTRTKTVQTTTATANQVIDDGGIFGGLDFTLADDAITKVSIELNAKKVGAAEGITIELKGTFVRDASGTPQRIDTDDFSAKYLGTSVNGTTANLNINGNKIELRVSPASADTLTWKIVRTQIEGLE